MPLEIPVHTVTARHPEVRKRAGASFSGRVGPRDPVLKVQQAKHKVPPACSHADDCACSLTAVGMTVCKKELASFRQQAGATTSLFLCFDESFSLGEDPCKSTLPILLPQQICWCCWGFIARCQSLCISTS